MDLRIYGSNIKLESKYTLVVEVKTLVFPFWAKVSSPACPETSEHHDLHHRPTAIFAMDRTPNSLSFCITRARSYIIPGLERVRATLATH